jgi:hypothetical protein
MIIDYDSQDSNAVRLPKHCHGQKEYPEHHPPRSLMLLDKDLPSLEDTRRNAANTTRDMQ